MYIICMYGHGFNDNNYTSVFINQNSQQVIKYAYT